MNDTAQPRITGNDGIHEVAARNRESITVNGVSEVVSFDEANVRLVTVCGILNLEGEGLRIHVLNTKDGVVAVTGRLNGLLYEDPEATKGGDASFKPRSRRLFGR